MNDDDVDPTAPTDDNGERLSRIVDVSGSLLAQLTADVESGADSALIESIRNILGDLDRSAQSISGWASYLDQ